jgi:arsenate reductase
METKHVVRALSALAQESRLAVFRLLVQAGPAGMAAGQIAARLGIAPSSLSFHMKELVHAELVTVLQQGRFMIYSANYPAMNAVLAFLTENCCGGIPCTPVGGRASTPAAIRTDVFNRIMSKTVLVLCTGNSCRSQMGQAILNHDLAGRVRAISAGTSPQPKVADGAIEALKLAGLQTDGLFPKSVEAVMEEPIDLVVSVCDNARESCPIFPRPVKRIHVGFHDPHGESLDSFVAVRDDIRARLVPAVLEALGL